MPVRRALSVACLLAVAAAPLALASPVGAAATAPYDTGRTSRVSISTTEAQGNGQVSRPYYPTQPVSLSRSGRYVTFTSTSSNLVPGDANGAGSDVFVRDRSNGTTTLVSRDEQGRQGDRSEDDCSDGICRFAGESLVSADGRVVAFTMQHAQDGADKDDLYVRDLQTGTSRELTTYARVLLAGISSSGRHVLGTSTSRYTNDTSVLLWDTVAGTRRLLARGESVYAGDVSDDGRYATYTKGGLDSAGRYAVRVYRQDLQSSAERLVSVARGGAVENGNSSRPSMSANGRFVAFSSWSSNLVAGDTNGKYDVFVRDLVAGTTRRVSVSSSGAQGNSASYPQSISDDGRYVAFTSAASNLVTSDTNARPDAFVRDTVGNRTRRVSVSSSGAQADVGSANPAISGDGLHVAFTSRATNLVPGDTNGQDDVFVRDAAPFG